ncbi:MAG: restriction endonuclease subunit S [Methanobacterium sp.]|nr:restriction endonuclease subunit S [Methanobacterium sp.]
MKLKPYPEYKDSAVEWIGNIPEDWKIRKLKHFTENLDGKRIPISAEQRMPGNIPYYGATGIVDYVDDFIFNEELLLVGEDGAPFFDKLKDVAFLIKGKTWVNNHAHVLRVLKKTNSKLLMHQLNQTDYSFFIKGSTRDKLNQEQLKEIPIIEPPEDTQAKIISFLDKKTSEIDLIIEKDTQLIELLKEKRTALINHVVTKGLDPTVKMKDSGVEWVGEIPEDWDARKLKLFVSKIGSGVTPKGGASVYVEEGIALLRSQNVHFDGLRLKNVSYITEEINKTMLNSVVKNKDVLLNITGASIGRCTYFENQVDKANVNQHVCIIRPEKIYYKFLNYVLMSDVGQDQIFSTQMGSSREGVNFEQIGNFIITYPPYEQQKDIADYLEESTKKIDLTIQKIEENIDLLEEYKKSLIHHVVTGKVDVREVAV